MGAAAVVAIVSTGIAVYAQVEAGKAAKSQAAYQAAVGRNNEILARRAANDARRRGDVEAESQRVRTEQLIGSQRASFASRGVVADEGTALAITTDTAGLGKLEELTIRSNAERQALGFEGQGSNFEAEARLAEARGQSAEDAALIGASSSLLAGAGSVANKWYGYRQTDTAVIDSTLGSN